MAGRRRRDSGWQDHATATGGRAAADRAGRSSALHNLTAVGGAGMTRQRQAATPQPRQAAPARPHIARRASEAARRDRRNERTAGTLGPKDRQAKYKKRFAAANAPRQPRRHCGARRRPSRERCQSRTQVTGRASGVVLHAVVRRRLCFVALVRDILAFLLHSV
jgi:hypothetical protein